MKTTFLSDYKTPKLESIELYSECGFAFSTSSEEPDCWKDGVHDWFEPQEQE